MSDIFAKLKSLLKKKKVDDVAAEVEKTTTDLFDTDYENAAVYCDNVVKIYKSEEVEVIALQGLDLRIDKGEIVAIIGNSGSGKSTLMNIIGGLDKPTAGMVFVHGNNMAKMTEAQIVNYKRKEVGFVWQNNARNLIPYLTAIENVQIPMLISGKRERKKRAKKLLDLVGLSHRYNSKLNQLSGGEQQRVAIAIALANEPHILLADEPTGAVDNKTADLIFNLFRTINKEMGVTIIVVTHDRTIAR
ncbi:MAG: ABC transporter ATP-binding protein, partial [Clostridia bacterium]|nr:ABC transporter ATP-binding protein [Clostridia bacterium]